VDAATISLIERVPVTDDPCQRAKPACVAIPSCSVFGRCWRLVQPAQLAHGLAVDGKTAARYIDLMVDLILVRRSQPFQSSLGRRLVKSPRVFIRESGVVHAPLNIT
jgi:hypothetical protein